MPEWREIDDETLRRWRVYVDSRELALEEYGDAIAAGRIHAERQPAFRIWWRPRRCFSLLTHRSGIVR